jgi:hypothetical protein
MTTKYSPTRKNKRMMSGGKGKSKYSKYATKFKRTCKAFKKFTDENDEINRVAKWGELRGIYGVLMNKKYRNSQESMLTAMKQGIMSSDGKNKDNYLNAITCLEKGDTTVLSDNGSCTPYIGESNNQEPPSPPPTNLERAAAFATGNLMGRSSSSSSMGSSSPDSSSSMDSEPLDDAAAPAPDAVAAATDASALTPASNVAADGDAANVDPAAVDGDATDVDDAAAPAPAPAPAADDTVASDAANVDPAAVDADATDADGDAANVDPDAAADADAGNEENKQSGGRSKHRARLSRRIKSRKYKSKKGRGRGRTTRRKHRSRSRR